jgi:flagellar motor switch protein FliN/FliY
MKTPNPGNAPLPQALLQCCEESVRVVLTQALGAAWKASIQTEAAEWDRKDEIILSFAAAKALRGRIDFAVRRADGLRLASAFTGESESANGEWNSDAREAVEELFRQIGGDVASRLGSHCGEVSLQFCAGETAAVTAGTEVWICAETGDSSAAVPICVRVSPELIESMQPESASQEDVKTAHDPQKLMPEGTLELLLGIELAATLRFGQKRMLLRDILDLNAGAVVELDRQVHEPVDLLLDGKVIARGDVVIVDGSYGLRVTEVASPSDRAGFLQ